jgi:CheY-like chemotaxis protein
MPKAVLIVDDSKLVLEMYRFLIATVGYTVYTATNGLEALELLAQQPVDLALVDINMPGMDGYTLTREIRRDPAWGEIPIIMISTETELGDQQQAFEAGANAYLFKPFPPGELLTKISLCIGEP